MKEKVMLLVDADCAGIVLEAGARTGQGVRLNRDSQEAFGFLNREFGPIETEVENGPHV